MDIDLKKIRDYFANDIFASSSGVVIDSVTEDEVNCSMVLGPGHMNAAGSVQGGAIFTLADLAFAVACNVPYAMGAADAAPSLGQSASISFLRTTRGKVLYAKTRRLSAGRSISVFEIMVTDDLGESIAVMTANAFTVRR